MWRACRHIGLLASLCMLFVDAHAQLNDTLKLKETEVVATQHKPAKSYRTTTIDSTFLKDEFSSNLGNALRYETGIFVKDYGPGALASLSFRGTGASHTQLYWNGLRLNSPTHGQADYSLFPGFFFETAELHHGIGGLINGSGGLGGGVQLLNQRERTPGLGGIIGGEFGSFNHGVAGATFHVTKQQWGIKTRLFYLKADQDFTFLDSTRSPVEERRNVGANREQHGLMQEGWFKVGKKDDITLRTWYTSSFRGLAPSLLEKDTAAFQEDQALRNMLVWNHFERTWRSEWITGYIDEVVNYENPTSGIRSKTHAKTLRNLWRPSFYVSNELVIRPQLFLDYESATSDGYPEGADRLTAGGQAQFSWQATMRLETNVLLRQEYYDNGATPFLPSLGVKYAILDSVPVFLKASIGRNYHAPTLNQQYWGVGSLNELEPETALMYEAGLAFQLGRTSYQISGEFTGFWSEVENWILWSPDVNGQWSASNLRAVNNYGTESSISILYSLDNWQLAATGGHTFTRSIITASDISNDAAIDKQLIYVPEHQANTSIRVRAPGGQSFGIFWSYTGERFITTDNTWWMPSYGLLDMELRWPVHKGGGNNGSTLRLRINNLLNRQYQAIAWRPMPGINFNVALKLAFQKNKK